jgi:hypothetical protein
MKAEILKIAGVKNEKEFYRKYPSEEAFMKTHGKAFKKAAMGANMVKKQLTQLTDFSNPPQAQFGIGLNLTGTSLGGSPTGGFDWTMGANVPITGAVGTPTLPGGNAQGMYQVSDFAKQGIQNDVMSTMNKKPGFDLLGKLGGAEGIGNLAGGVIQGIKQEKGWKAQKKASEAAKNISALTLRASRSRPSDPMKHYYNRPEDAIISGAELSPRGFAQGTNTNILAAEDGAMIGGNPTEIQNTYNPGDLYSNLGYEPLSESDIVKQYAHGGGVHKAQLGDILGQVGGMTGVIDKLGGLTGTGANSSGLYSTIGNIGSKLVPGALGSALGPIGAFAQFAVNDQRKRTLANNAAATQYNLQQAGAESAFQGLNSQYGSYMKDGGWVSHDWQPQVITKFGDVDVSQIHSIATEGMDTLRTGGHITQNNIYETDQFNFGGQLQTTWGGRAETMSHNPYLPGSGETVMFKGNSHEESDRKGRTGIGVKYGNDGEYSPYMEYGRDGVEDVTDVEVERGEPATELQDSTGDTSMVVFGNLKIPKQFIGEIGDDSINYGEKFKTYAKRKSIEEAKQNKIVDKASQLIDIDDDGTPFGDIAMNSARAMMDGANQKLKNIAQFKQNAASVQNAINETAEENMLDADALAKGKIKIDKEAMKQQAKWGKAINKAQKGYVSKYGIEPWKGNIQGPYKGALSASEFTTQDWDKVAENLGFKGKGNKEFEEFLLKNPRAKDIITKRHQERYGKDPWVDPEHFGYGWAAPDLKNLGRTKMTVKAPEAEDDVTSTTTPATMKDVQALPTEKKKKFDWLQGLNTLLPYLQKPYESEMPNLYPEMMALATNTLEPVKAQGIQSLLETPYDISLQDQINEITAGERAAQRMAMGDPSALANIAAQSSAAKNKVLAEQFRMNQAERAGVYGRNRATLMDTQLKNLGIFADQEQKQQMAKSKTKSTALEAMQSMADKIDKRRSEDRMIRLYENMYPNYRLTGDQRMVPTGLTLFPGATVASSPTGATPPYVGDKRTSTTDTTTAVSAKKGKIVKKNSLNSTVVRALKNI